MISGKMESVNDNKLKKTSVWIERLGDLALENTDALRTRFTVYVHK